MFSDKCTGLPDVFDLKTSTSLPVDHGTTVEVDCVLGYSLSGSRLITCIKDKNWEFVDTPVCVLGGFEVEVQCRLTEFLRERLAKVICFVVMINIFSHFSDTCTELPAAVSDMTTTTTFPVIVGTVVEVACKTGHTLTGDNTITCIRDSSFNINQRPICTIG